MRLVDRYLLREYLVPLGYCMLTFAMVFVIYDLFDHLSRFLDAKTPLVLILKYYACTLQAAWEHLMPASVLLAALYTLWQLARNNELTALQAGGISLYRAMVPFLGVGLVATALTAAVNETFSTRAGLWAEQFRLNRFQADGGTPQERCDYFNVEEGRLWHIDAFDPAEPERLTGVRIVLERSDGTKEREIVAGLAEWLDGRWWFFDGWTQDYYPTESLRGTPQPLPRGGVEYGFLDERPGDLAAEVKDWDFMTAREMGRYLDAHPSLSDREWAQKKSDQQRRMALPWACLVATLFAVPAGARGARHNALIGILSAVALFFCFYALFQVGLFLGKRQILWPWLGAWLSNIVFVAAGLVLLRRMR